MGPSGASDLALFVIDSIPLRPPAVGSGVPPGRVADHDRATNHHLGDDRVPGVACRRRSSRTVTGRRAVDPTAADGATRAPALRHRSSPATMRAMRWRRPRERRAAPPPAPATIPPAPPPGPPEEVAGASSRTSAAAAGWGRRPAGPVLADRRRSPLAARNAVLARVLGDPTDEARGTWLRRLDEYARADGAPPPPADRLVHRFAGLDRASVAVLGAPGAGRAAQYAVAPVLLAAAGATDLAVACGDTGAPAGGLRSYEERLFRPYADYPAPIYGVPGPQDWHDGLVGFMTAFCDVPPGVRAPVPAEPGPAWARVLRRLLWRRSPATTFEELAAARMHRDDDDQWAVQPGPYCAVDAGPLRLVLVDTGLTGRVDRAQADWLRAVSTGDRPKILLAARPIFAGARLHRVPVEGGGDLNEIVTDPAHGYVAAVGAAEHSYQRYPVRLRDGRTLQYVVAGASGAPLSATHRIPDVDRLAPAVLEHDFRCYPLRGDSLARFSSRHRGLLGLGSLAIGPDDAATIMAERIGVAATRPSTPPADVPARARRAAEQVYPYPATGQVLPQNPPPALIEPRRPPLFRSLLRIDAAADEIVLSCFAATGADDAVPVREDRVRARREGAVWRWTDGP